MNDDKILEKIIKSVKPIDKEAYEKAVKRQSKLAKPPGSLGVLEELSAQVAGITGKIRNEIKNKHLLVFASDNGVVEESVSSAPQSVTLMQTVNLTKAKTGASALAKHFSCRISVYDVGVNADIKSSLVKNRKIAYGTSNIFKGPAMTREQAVQAVKTGYEAAVQEARDGADIIGIGEMGIGNTTTSSAVIAALTGENAESVTGRGGGINDASFEKKKRVIERAIEINKPDRNDVIDVISKVGGFDIGAMAGAFIGASSQRVPAVIDGFISVTAALCAVRMCPEVKEYLIPSHKSCERGYLIAVGELGLKPMLDLKMRLGEGSGCPLAFEIVSAACAVLNNMALFDEAGIDDGYLDEIRENERYTSGGSNE